MTSPYDPTEHEDAREDRAREVAAKKQHTLVALHDEGADVILVLATTGAFEYFCWQCGHLRLFARSGDEGLEPFERCGNCGNDGKGDKKILLGETGSLDKETLKRLWMEANSTSSAAHGAEASDDPRIVYGAHCTWWDSVDKAGRISPSGLLCCPHCKSVLFEMESLEKWMAAVDDQERKAPGYRGFIEWLRGRCFASYEAAQAAYLLRKG